MESTTSEGQGTEQGAQQANPVTPKRGRGRPKGSKNKRKVGRPKGSKAKVGRPKTVKTKSKVGRPRKIQAANGLLDSLIKAKVAKRLEGIEAQLTAEIKAEVLKSL